MVNHEPVLCGELTVLELISGIHGQLAFADVVARVFAGIRREIDQIDVGNFGLKVEKLFLRQRIELSRDLHRRVAGIVASQVQIGQGVGGRGQALDAAAQLGDGGRVVGFDEAVRKIHAPVLQGDFGDLNGHGHSGG